MGLKNFSKDDLRASKLAELVRQLREAVSNRDYKTIEEFARAFATELQSSTILVEHKKIPGGKIETRRVLDVNGEAVDVSQSVSTIMSEIDETRTFSETDATKVAEYEKMYATVDSQLTALFMQDKMMEELASRGFPEAEFAKQAVQANKRSDEKIRVYGDNIKKYGNIEKAVLEPHDGFDTNGNVKKVSLKTKLKDEQDAKVYLEGLKHDIDSIKDLEAAIESMEAAIAADSTKEATYREKIDANKRQVMQLTNDMKGKVQSLKDLKLPGLNVASIENCDDPAKMDRATATTAIETLYTGMDARILDAYKKIAANLRNTKKAGKDTFEPSELAEIAKIDSADPAEVEAGKKAIEAAMLKIERTIETNRKLKAQEETLKIARTKSTAEYQRVVQRKKDLEGKFEQIQETDADGHPIYLDASGNDTLDATDPSGRPNKKRLKEEQVHDADGNPLYIDASGNVTKDARDPVTGAPNYLYVTDLFPKHSTEDQYLRDAGFDKAAKVSAVKTAKENQIKALSWSERRSLLKSYGIGNLFSRFFSSKKLVDSQIPTLVAGETSADLTAIESDARKIISRAANAERIELDDVSIFEEQTRKAYDDSTRAAALQREMANGAYGNNEVLRNRTVNLDAVAAMQDAALEQTSLIMARTLLSGRDLSSYEEAMKRYTYRQVTREHNAKKGISDNAQNPQHEDIFR